MDPVRANTDFVTSEFDSPRSGDCLGKSYSGAYAIDATSISLNLLRASRDSASASLIDGDDLQMSGVS